MRLRGTLANPVVRVALQRVRIRLAARQFCLLRGTYFLSHGRKRGKEGRVLSPVLQLKRRSITCFESLKASP